MPPRPAPDDAVASVLPAADVRRLLAGVLPRPEAEGARLVMRGWLDALHDARRRWQERPEMDALHDVRVAVRRLRAAGKAHAPLLGDAYPRPVRRALRRLGDATGAMRDLQVQRAWLRAEGERLGDAARAEAERLAAWLDEELPRERERVARALERAEAGLDGWEARLDTVPVRLLVGRPTVGAPYARALAEALARGERRLAAALAALAHPLDEGARLAAEHVVRVRLKAQRALLAPVAEAAPAVAAWHDLATRGQDRLGAIRDAALLAGRARDEGAHGVAAALEDVALAHREAFAAEWLRRPEAAEAAREEAVRWLRQAAPPVTPVGLPVEVERKYLLRALPPEAAAVAPVAIAQGWLPGTALRERLRRTTHPDGRTTLTRTVKLGPASARLEVEEGVEPALFEALWPLTAAARVTKARRTLVEADAVWEVDWFTDRELVLAEVEMRGDEAPPPPPSWLAPYIVRDVTHEPEFTNAALARPAGPLAP